MSFSTRAGVEARSVRKTSSSLMSGHISGPDISFSSAAASSSQSTVYLVAKVVSLCFSCSATNLSSSSICFVAFLFASPSEATISFRRSARLRHVDRGMIRSLPSVAMPQSCCSLQFFRSPATTPCVVCSSMTTGRPAARLQTSLRHDSSRSLMASASFRQTSRIQLSMKALQAGSAPSRCAMRCAICIIASSVLVWRILPVGSSDEKCFTMSTGSCSGEATCSRSSAMVSMRGSVFVFSLVIFSGDVPLSALRKSPVRPATTILRESHSR
mmetsp:Transcript_46504/g.120324  ORF Transcript_46504/g.120324 Transcript_46504/m.120324 type:complete len:271 (+) Transcript_46504:1199-2011(+)